MSHLIIDKNVPKWAQQWIRLAKAVILPEWEVEVAIDDDEDVEGRNSRFGIVYYKPEYLTAVIHLNAKLEDNPDGHYTIIHEFTHPILSTYGQLENNIVMMCMKERPQYEYESMMNVVEEMKRQTDELACTRVSRIFYNLIKETKKNASIR